MADRLMDNQELAGLTGLILFDRVAPAMEMLRQTMKDRYSGQEGGDEGEFFNGALFGILAAYMTLSGAEDVSYADVLGLWAAASELFEEAYSDEGGGPDAALRRLVPDAFAKEEDYA